MSSTSPFAPYCSSGVVLQSRTCRRSSHRASSFDLAGCNLPNDNEYACRFLYNPRSLSLNTSSQQLRRVQNGRKNTKMDISVNNNISPEIPPLPSDSSPGSWKLWLVGVIVSIVIPFWKNKWGPLKKLQEEVETVVETAETVTDVIEDVAKEVEKLADELGDRLPKGGKLQQAAQFVENLADETVKTADAVEDILNKVEEVENQVEEFIDDQMDKTKEGKDGEKQTQKVAEKTDEKTPAVKAG